MITAWLYLALMQSTTDVEQGKRWYNTQCAGCHGLSGDGGSGANLAVPKLRHATNDSAGLNG